MSDQLKEFNAREALKIDVHQEFRDSPGYQLMELDYFARRNPLAEVSELDVSADTALAGRGCGDVKVSDGEAAGRHGVATPPTDELGKAIDAENHACMKHEQSSTQRNTANGGVTQLQFPIRRRARDDKAARGTSLGQARAASGRRLQELRARNIVHANKSRRRRKFKEAITRQEIAWLEKDIGRIKAEVQGLHVDVEDLSFLLENHPCDLPVTEDT